MSPIATNISNVQLWEQSLALLQKELPKAQYDLWLAPLQCQTTADSIIIFAPNCFIVDQITSTYLPRIKELMLDMQDTIPTISIENALPTEMQAFKAEDAEPITSSASESEAAYESRVNCNFKFDNYVEGKSNQLARAAAVQVAANPGRAYNPLVLCGGVGLGKTHLAHAVGNQIKQDNPKAKVIYLSSERFVADMVRSLQNNAMDKFKKHYRSIDCLLIDDIQFFAGKDRSQEEFFHTFNALLDNDRQIVLTCDRYPKEINGLEERLKSRFSWGLTVPVEPPDLETRVAILKTKAAQSRFSLPDEVAFFIAKHIQSNVRELEGALKRVMANAHFTGQPATVDFVRDALKDLLTLHTRLVSIDYIQRSVAEYYKIKLSDLLSKSRSRSVARPRQIAMALAKELTGHSLPELGEAFGGRDHTTVLHACRKVNELLTTSVDIQEDYKNLLRILSA